jgi:hypothetical protein
MSHEGQVIVSVPDEMDDVRRRPFHVGHLYVCDVRRRTHLDKRKRPASLGRVAGLGMGGTV